jgi:hypothetical protein
MALDERRRERTPLFWAESFGNQGMAMALIAARTHDGALAETAVQQIEAAGETAHAGGNEYTWAFFQKRLPKAQAIRDRLKGK